MTRCVIFTVIAYALSITLALVIGLTGGHNSALIGLSYLSMFLPAAAVVIVSVAMNERPRIRWDSLPARYLPIALFLIPDVLHAVMLPLVAAFEGGLHWQDWLIKQSDGLYHAPVARGWGTLTTQELVGHIVLNAVAGLVIVSFLAVFEEVGWRAWLLPRLREHIGSRRAVVATSVIWALWHVPFQLSGIQHIDGVSPMKLALTIPPGTLAMGLILGWMWLRTESIWLVAIAHGAANNWGQYAFKYLKDSGTPNRDMTILLAGSAALLLVGTVLLFSSASADSRERYS